MKDYTIDRQETSEVPDNVPFRIAFQIYLLLLNITLMVLSIISYCQIIDVQDYLYNINHNWSLQPFKSIRYTEGDCVQNEEIINHYIWPGIEQGCDCRYNEQYIEPRRILYTRKDKLLEQECNSSMRAAGCQDIVEMSSRDFIRLPVDFGNKSLRICGLREVGNNSFALNSPKVNECKENELKCGTNSDYFYCTQEKECPIFQMKNNSNFDSESQDYFQTFRQNDNLLPLVEFKIAQGNGVCRKINERSITSGRSNYELISDPGYDCERDPRFQLIYLFDEFNFFQANKALDIAKKAPGYHISSLYQWGLYGRNYINFTLSCRKYQKEFMDSVEYLENIESQQLILMIISIICVTVFILMLILNCLTIFGLDLPFISGKGTQESNKLFFIQFTLKELTQIANAIIIIINFDSLQGRINFFKKLIDQNCSDKFTLDEFQMILDVLKTSIYTFNFVYIILFFIGVFIDILVGIFLAYQNYKKRKGQNQQQDKYKDISTQNNNEIKQNKKHKEQPLNNEDPFHSS
ncbi:unnamed protein product [Paramecium pentaurelia]|uniref:Transmembrane protein n=1 Tax=Paramecium pentaurelia TaxID=43138 RepID=A0A8S1XEK1_9CILI|nr:unnamed protein product [Paramecium pentaurelia]